MGPVYMAFLRFMGDEMEAQNYSYSLEVGGNGRKLIWEGNPRSIWDSHKKVRDSHDGLIIQRNMALFFSGGDRKELNYELQGGYGKNSRTQKAGPAYLISVVRLLGSHSASLPSFPVCFIFMNYVGYNNIISACR